MIHTLLRIAGPDRLVYRSGYCWTPLPLTNTLIKMMDLGPGEMWTEDTIKEFYVGNTKVFGL